MSASGSRKPPLARPLYDASRYQPEFYRYHGPTPTTPGDSSGSDGSGRCALLSWKTGPWQSSQYNAQPLSPRIDRPLHFRRCRANDGISAASFAYGWDHGNAQGDRAGGALRSVGGKGRAASHRDEWYRTHSHIPK